MNNYLLSILPVLLLVSCSSSSNHPPAESLLDVVVSGKVQYQDRVYNNNGFIVGNEPMKPVRYAIVDLTDLSGNVQASSATDNAGNYSISASVAAGNYNIRVLAQTEVSSGYDVTINTVNNQIYSVTSVIGIDEVMITQTSDINIDLASTASGAFNMLDVYTIASEFVEAHSPGQNWLPALNVFWTEANSSYGTYTCSGYDASYCTNGSGIYVIGANSGNGYDSDEYDDDVLYHEFSHFVEFALGQYDSPGGMHYFSDTTLDLRLSWSEGNADYLQSAIKSWLQANMPLRLSTPVSLSPTWYIDTAGDLAQIALDLGSLSTAFKYSSNEASVANVLIGFKNSTGLQPNWDALTGYLSSNITADTLESFWEGFLLGQPGFGATEWNQWQVTLQAREINYRQDNYESDDDYATATVIDCTLVGTCLNAEEHFLYKGPEQNDADFFAVSLTAGLTYTFKTENLKNGGDTVIRLYAPSQVLVDQNDEASYNDPYSKTHNGVNFVSEISSYLAPSTGTYYLEVATSSDVINDPVGFGYIGRFGTYSLTITAN